MASALNIVYCNLHGLAQVASLLSDLCKTFDIVFVQEHWFPSFNLVSLNNFSDAMLCYAMEEVISVGSFTWPPFWRIGYFC